MLRLGFKRKPLFTSSLNPEINVLLELGVHYHLEFVK